MDQLVSQVTHRLASRLTGHYAFYGHSMGSLVAYGVARRQLSEGRSLPTRLVVGAHRAPHLPHSPELSGRLSDSAAVDLLLGLGGTGSLVTRDSKRMKAVADRLRDDLRVCRTYRHSAEEQRPLPCPVHVLYGTDDPLVSPADAAAWRMHASAQFSLHEMPGGHFFNREHEALFFAELGSILQPVGHERSA